MNFAQMVYVSENGRNRKNKRSMDVDYLLDDSSKYDSGRINIGNFARYTE